MPYFVEFHTSRKLEHCGPNYDDDLNYRDKNFLNYWKKNDPVEKLEKTLLKKKYLSKKEILSFKSKIKDEIIRSFNYAENSKPPKFEHLNQNLFSK